MDASDLKLGTVFTFSDGTEPKRVLLVDGDFVAYASQDLLWTE